MVRTATSPPSAPAASSTPAAVSSSPMRSACSDCCCASAHFERSSYSSSGDEGGETVSAAAPTPSSAAPAPPTGSAEEGVDSCEEKAAAARGGVAEAPATRADASPAAAGAVYVLLAADDASGPPLSAPSDNSGEVNLCATDRAGAPSMSFGEEGTAGELVSLILLPTPLPLPAPSRSLGVPPLPSSDRPADRRLPAFADTNSASIFDVRESTVSADRAERGGGSLERASAPSGPTLLFAPAYTGEYITPPESLR